MNRKSNILSLQCQSQSNCLVGLACLIAEFFSAGCLVRDEAELPAADNRLETELRQQLTQRETELTQHASNFPKPRRRATAEAQKDARKGCSPNIASCTNGLCRKQSSRRKSDCRFA